MMIEELAGVLYHSFAISHIFPCFHSERTIVNRVIYSNFTQNKLIDAYEFMVGETLHGFQNYLQTKSDCICNFRDLVV